MKFKAFTLAEILIALIIVAVVSGAVISGLRGMTSYTNRPAFQKCYSHLTQTVTDMLNDKLVYPDIPISESNLTLIGLMNNYNEDGTVDNDKFYNEFSKRTLGAVATTPTVSSSKAFVAQDKSFWQFTNKAKGSGLTDDVKIIEVDVNGLDKGPNCPNSFGPGSTPASCPDPDRFDFYVYRDGTIQVNKDSTGYGSSKQKQLDFLNANGYFGVKQN